MGQDINIDFSPLASQPNAFTSYANGYRIGRQLAGDQITSNAMQAAAANPDAPIDPRLAASDPQAFMTMQDRQRQAQDRTSSVAEATAESNGDLQGAMTAAAQRGATGDVATLKAQLDAIPEQQRQAAIAKARESNEALAHVLQGLKGYPPEQRLSIAQHIAQTSGLLDPSTITPDDVTDNGINAHLASVLTTDQFLKNEHENAVQAETSRHNRSQEGFEGQRVGLEGARVGIERARLGIEQQKASAGPGGSLALPVATPGATAKVTIGQIPDADRRIVQALIDGRYDIPKGAALRNPQMVRYLQEAAAVDPTFDVANATTRVATRKDFTSGKSAQTITALNQALGHGALAAADIQHLPGTPVPLLNSAINAVSDPFTGNATAFRTHARALATEAAKVFQGGAPHEGEVKEYANTIANPDASAVQIRSAVQSLTELLGSRLEAMKGQYTQGMGRSSTPLEVLHPDAASAFARLSHLRSSLGGGGHGQPVKHGNSQILSVEP